MKTEQVQVRSATNKLYSAWLHGTEFMYHLHGTVAADKTELMVYYSHHSNP